MSHRIILGVLLMPAVLAISGAACAAASGNTIGDPSQHFDPKGKMPSEFTVKLRKIEKADLPFADKRDFEEAKKAAHSYHGSEENNSRAVIQRYLGYWDARRTQS